MRLALSLICTFVLCGCPQAPDQRSLAEAVADLQQQALQDETAWRLLESLTSEVGPRMAGSVADARAVAWAVEKMNDLGFDRVWLEPVDFPLWVRDSESGRVLSPEGFELDLTALGGTPGTGGTLRGDVVHFESLASLEAAEPGSLGGKIAFISAAMRRDQGAAGYSETVPQRSRGPFVAARKGASALLIRSIGTDTRNSAPHAGNVSSLEPGESLPAAALSNASADRLVELLQGEGPVAVELELDVGYRGRASSHNVIGEFTGASGSGEFVLIGGHLDSWDLGSGAHDDGAGVAITLAAAKLVADQAPRPARGIRVVLFANEEQGVHGGKAYAAAHANELSLHVLGSESDLGAGRIYEFRTRVNEAAEPDIAELAELLAPLGIPHGTDALASGGADIGEMRKIGLPVIDLRHDASQYFDLHHTRNDTLDTVDPADLKFNVAAYVTLLQWAASSDTSFGPIEPSE
jgi:Zn-dependent M28 family amino/carboxypeptidase